MKTLSIEFHNLPNADTLLKKLGEGLEAIRVKHGNEYVEERLSVLALQFANKNGLGINTWKKENTILCFPQEELPFYPLPFMTTLFTVYAKKLPTKDVQIYKDKEANVRFARFPFETSGKYMTPRKGQKRITLNCFPYNLQWLN